MLKANSKVAIANKEAEEAAKAAIQEQALNVAAQAFGLLGQLAGKNKALQAAAIVGESAVGIAKMVMANNTANIAALATPQAIATSGASAVPVIAMNNVSTALGVASTIAAAAKGIKALGGGATPPSAPGPGSGGAGRPASPTFSVVGQSPSTVGSNAAAADSQIDNNNNNPQRAYVVSTDITNQQALDRDIEDSNALG